MAEFAVNTTRLKSCSTQISAVQRELGGVASRLGAMQWGSILRIRASTALANRITDCRWAADNQSGDLGSLARSLSDIAGMYDTCETNLMDPKTETQPQAQPGGAAEGVSYDEQTNEGNFPKWFEIVLELMGAAGEECGPLLTLVGLFGLFDGTGEGYAGGAKNILAGLSNIFGGLDFTDGGAIQVKWKDMFGLSPSDIGKFDWDGAVDDWISDHLVSGNNTWTENAGAVCKWASYALSFVVSGVKNYEEYQQGNMSNARFVGETLIEGSVDIGLGALAGVAAAALLPATWPAIAVGAVGAVAYWGIDKVCEWITGESIGENIANLVCDGVEATVDFVQDVGDAIADGVETAWNNVCDWVDGWW